MRDEPGQLHRHIYFIYTKPNDHPGIVRLLGQAQLLKQLQATPQSTMQSQTMAPRRVVGGVLSARGLG